MVHESDPEKPVTYWHGGFGGLKVGDEITPAVNRPLPVHYELLPDDYPSDPEKVYVTVDRQHARTFAAKMLPANTGWLYEVEPVGDLVEDPDFAGLNVSYMAPAATIVNVAERGVIMGEVELIKAEVEYMRWQDGTRTHLPTGYLNPPPEALAAGITEEDCRQLGRWPDVAEAQEFMTALYWRRQGLSG